MGEKVVFSTDWHSYGEPIEGGTFVREEKEIDHHEGALVVNAFLSNRQTWDYLVEEPAPLTLLSEYLGDRGAEGWQLVHTNADKRGQQIYIFKRPGEGWVKGEEE